MTDTEQRTCSSCGAADPPWLVSWPYGEPSGPGRLLAYCEDCRLARREVLCIVMPFVVVDTDRESVMTALYGAGLVGTDPHSAADVLNLHGDWVDAVSPAAGDEPA